MFTTNYGQTVRSAYRIAPLRVIMNSLLQQRRDWQRMLNGVIPPAADQRINRIYVLNIALCCCENLPQCLIVLTLSHSGPSPIVIHVGAAILKDK